MLEKKKETGRQRSTATIWSLRAGASQPRTTGGWLMAGQDIDNLLASIEDQVAAGNSAHKWVPAEEDLLLLLRRFRLSYADISTVSLTMITGMVLPCESG